MVNNQKATGNSFIYVLCSSRQLTNDHNTKKSSEKFTQPSGISKYTYI